MDDKKQLIDAELQKLLAEIEAPEPDENEKLGVLNMAESRFEQNAQKNKKTHQGTGDRSRLMDVIATTFITLTGGKNMKKSYALAGVLAIGVAGIALVGHIQGPQYQSFSKMSLDGSEQLAASSKVKMSPAKKDPTLEDILNSVENPNSAQYPDRAFDAYMPTTNPTHAESEMVKSYAADAPVRREAKKPRPTPSHRAPQALMSQESIGAGASADMAMPTSIMPVPPHPEPMPQMQNRDKFDTIKQNPVKSAQTDPVSTFSIDVDTSSYAVMRRALNNGQMPAANAVRTEELINYFDYDYPTPESREEPFQPTVALYQTPWNADTMLMHVGIKGHELPADAKKSHSNLVFLLDVSGSMNQQDKLPLLQKSFSMLVDNMQPDDTISIVTYAGRAGVVLEPTKVSEKAKILSAINNLRSGGSTAGAQGIRTAYDLAQQNFDDEGVNRVILATDGDFNVGITNQDELKKYIEDKRNTGIYLSVLGFGTGNYNDALMQTLAQNGNGNAAYIDSINEARKVLVDEATSTLYPIANDVKIQVEFNPLKVAEYRLIGYENRLLNREDFNNDKIDAGDIGAGHTVTAIYEVTPVGSKAQMIDDLRYGRAHDLAAKPASGEGSNEYAFLKMRYKLPGESKSKLITQPIGEAHMRELDGLSDDIRFAGAVAAFGQILRGESYVGDYSYDDVLQLASPARGTDAYNYRGEFLTLVRNAKVAQ